MKGDLHVKVPPDSPHAKIETSVVDDELLAKPSPMGMAGSVAYSLTQQSARLAEDGWLQDVSQIFGRATAPPQLCCGGLHQLYHQQPNCICLLLNDSTLSSFPINTTLALQLPLLCNLQLDSSTCSGLPLPPSSPASQVSFGTTTNSNSAASPTVTLGPRPTIIGFGQSGGARLNMEGHLVVTAAAAILCTKLLSH
ncbi:hypothetical protein Acr_26g0000690 [Actinidia rufa]|uniref:Bifunctional inhibitor/plant lipid transfer protein/seed storage helical domain-containing protein n=1 Tax=Actinidia rufa TaxID=165716 RepID=A0A7J0H133_9ERIC|nr:hypothetical protein Acr_26g0000690 [Actinidia rufa]